MRIMRIIHMARLNITIPDELYAALEMWRGRINISKVCQEAIAKELAKLQDLPRQAVELDTLVDRLREEKATSDKAFFAQGVSDAIAWARGAPYQELRLCGEHGQHEGRGRDRWPEALQRALRRYASDPTFDEAAYAQGWLAGVSEVWQRVKDKV